MLTEIILKCMPVFSPIPLLHSLWAYMTPGMCMESTHTDPQQNKLQNLSYLPSLMVYIRLTTLPAALNALSGEVRLCGGCQYQSLRCPYTHAQAYSA